MLRDEESNLTTIDVTDLNLDRKNFRIDYSKIKNNDDLNKLLFQEEKIMEMAQSIVSRNGLYPHEFMIVVKEDGKNIVMEGNRRVLAIRCLLDASFVPLEYRTEFKRAVGRVNEELKSKISKVRAVFMSRDDALKIVADKHSDISYRKWSLLSQWRFMRERFFSSDLDINKTIEFLDPERPTDVPNGIKFINLIEYVRGLRFWDEDGLRVDIEKNRIEPTRLTRALGYTDVVNALHLSFDEKFEVAIQSGTDKGAFDWVLFNFAKSALIDSDEWANINTRSSKDEIVSLVQSWYKEYSEKNKEPSSKEGQNSKESGNSKEGNIDPEKNKNGKGTTKEPDDKTQKAKGKNPVKYFSDLKCTVEDQRLKRLTKELTKITMTQFPAAAIMLTRSLIESTLIYQIEKKDLKNEYHNYKGKDGLKKILNFSINSKARLFKDPKSANGLEYLENTKYKDFMDDIVHSKWIDPTDSDIASIAGKIRELLKAILTDDA
ncbi:MAG: ParB N-terminal domain-containing protein [Cuniculiplasma sp.]